MPLSRQSVEAYEETSSRATHQDCVQTDPGLKSGINVRKLMYTLTKKINKKVQAGNEWSNLLQKSLQSEDKSTI